MIRNVFVRSCPSRLYDNGNGLVDRLVKEFPRYNDVSPYDGHSVSETAAAGTDLGDYAAVTTCTRNGEPIADLDKRQHL